VVRTDPYAHRLVSTIKRSRNDSSRAHHKFSGLHHLGHTFQAAEIDDGEDQRIIGLYYRYKPYVHADSFNVKTDATDQSFSDFPLLSPSSPSLAITDLSTIHDLSNCFLEGRLSGSEFLQEAKADHGDFERKPDGKMEGKKGSVVLHLLGKQV